MLFFQHVSLRASYAWYTTNGFLPKKKLVLQAPNAQKLCGMLSFIDVEMDITLILDVKLNAQITVEKISSSERWFIVWPY